MVTQVLHTAPSVTGRLSRQEYERLEKELIPPNVTDRTTAEQVAFSLGVQHVLRRIREGYMAW